MAKLKTAAFDMFLNIFATLIPMAALQLVILPLVARDLSDADYGIALASIALLGLIPLTAGNVINNVRLLRDSEYRRNDARGDFSLIVVVACALCSVSVSVGSYVVGVVSLMELVLVAIASALMLGREYLVVEYRLKLNYLGILYTNLWQALGQFVGLAALFALDSWAFVYVFGYLASDVYLLLSTSIWREPLGTTPRLRATLGDVASLGFANILNKLTNYADRLVLIPLAGASSVSVYYVACLFGKVLSLIVSPINNVLLSYLAKESRAARKEFWIALASSGALCVAGYAVTILASHPLISLLYPQYVDAAMTYVPIATAASYVMVLSNVANPFVMRFCDLRWQTAMNAVFCASFFLGSVAGYYIDGLLGFCVGVLLANCVRLVLAVAIYLTRTESGRFQRTSVD